MGYPRASGLRALSKASRSVRTNAQSIAPTEPSAISNVLSPNRSRKVATSSTSPVDHGYRPAALHGPEALHRQLAHWNHGRLAPAFPQSDWSEGLASDARMQQLEGAWIEHLRGELQPAVAGV